MDNLPIIPFLLLLTAYSFGLWRGFKWGRRTVVGIANSILNEAKQVLREAEGSQAEADALLTEIKKTLHDGKDATAQA